MRRRLVLFALLGLALASATPPAHAQAIELKLATAAPEGSATRRTLEEWATKVATRTGGKVNVRFRPLGEETKAVRKMAKGQLAAATLTGVGLEEIQPAVRVLDLPFLFENDEQLDNVRGGLDGEFRQLFADKGYVLLAWGDAGPVRLYSTKAIPTVEALRTTKVGVSDTLMNALIGSLAVAVPHTGSHELLLLERGLIDAYGGSSAAMLFSWNSKLTHATSMIVARPTAATVVTKRFFDTLTPEQQTILVEESQVLQQTLIARARTEEDTALAQLMAKGLVIGQTPHEVERKFREAADSVGSNFDGKLYSRDLREKVDAQRTTPLPTTTSPPPTTTTQSPTTTTPPPTTTSPPPTTTTQSPTTTTQPPTTTSPPPTTTTPTPTVIAAAASRLTIGAEVTFFHPTHMRFMRIDGGRSDFAVNGSGPGTAASALPVGWKWERFRVIDAGNGRVALYNQELKRFVRLHTSFEVDSTPLPDPYGLPARWNLERFEVQLLPGGRVALYQADLKRYLSMKSDHDFEGATAPMGFDVGILKAPSLVPGSVVALFHQAEKCFVRVHGTTGRADCGGHQDTPAELPADWTWERFLVVDGGAGRVALYNTTTKRFLRMTPDSPPADVPANDMDSSSRASADLPADWSWERFTVEERGLGVVALGNHSPRRYLSRPSAGPAFDLTAETAPGLYLVHVLTAAPTAARK